MADYTSEKVSAYNDIVAAGTAITIRRKHTSVYNDIADVSVHASAQLNGAINNVVTTLILQNVVGTFYTTNGTIWIDKEKMFYTTLAGLNMSGITRGYGGTRAVAHLDLANVYLEPGYTDYGTYGVIINPNLGQYLGTVTEDYDFCMLVPAYNLSITPEQTDSLILGGIEYNIWTIKPVTPSNDPIIYKIFTRRVLLSE